jgi:hypothetical protein
MASAFRVWRPVEWGAPACWGGSAHSGRPAHAVPGRARDACSAVVTTRATALWHGRRHQSGGPSAARSWARAPRISSGDVGQGEQRRGSPRAAVDCEAGWRLGAVARGGVLTGGRVGGNSG